jgi:hypothetical protein
VKILADVLLLLLSHELCLSALARGVLLLSRHSFLHLFLLVLVNGLLPLARQSFLTRLAHGLKLPQLRLMRCRPTLIPPPLVRCSNGLLVLLVTHCLLLSSPLQSLVLQAHCVTGSLLLLHLTRCLLLLFGF